MISFPPVPLFPAFSVVSVGPPSSPRDKYHGNPHFRSSSIPTMVDTEQLLRFAREYSEHEYARYVGGVSLLAGAAVWFYATDISRALKVSSVKPAGPTLLLTYFF